MPDLTVRICGVNVRASLSDEALARTARRRFAPFLAKGHADLALQVHVLAPRERPTGAAWVVRRDVAVGPRGRATIAPAVSSLDSLFRVALSTKLVTRGAFLCHSAAVDGWLFPGRSGAGKSTLGEAAPQGRVLADELVGVAPGRLSGTPFWGNFRKGRNNGSHPLRGIFFLDRRAPRGARPLEKPRALARLLECVLFFGDDARSAGKILAIARRVVESAPTFVLSYDARTTPFSGVEEIIHGALQ